MTGPTRARTRRDDPLDPDVLAALEEERDFLLRSIRDLEAEHDAGDLDDEDFETLRDEYTARAARTLRAIRDRRALMDENRRPRSIGRTALTFAVIIAFAALVGLLISRSIGARGVDDTATGGIGAERSPNQRALDCQTLIDPVEPGPAIDCYEAVLSDDSRNAIANTWLAWQLELAARDDLDDREAERIEGLIDAALDQRPDYSYALAFRAIIAFRHGKPEDAARYLDEFEAMDPSPDARSVIENFDLRERIDEALLVSGPDREAIRCRGLIDPDDPIAGLECFRAVLDDDPDNPIANTWIAFQLEQTVPLLPPEDAARARRTVDEHLDRALDVAPEDPYALALRAVFAHAHGEPEIAREMYDRFLAVDPPEDARRLVEEYGLPEQLGR